MDRNTEREKNRVTFMLQRRETGVEEIRWRTKCSSCDPRRKVLELAGQLKGMGTPISHHTHAIDPLGMHNNNPDCMFFKLGKIIVHPCGFCRYSKLCQRNQDEWA